MLQHGNSVNALAIAPACTTLTECSTDDPGAFLIGAHPLMQRIIALVRRVAVTDATVLITGESGTGKEVVARMIHSLSPRANSPLLPINCAAIPHARLESELFGHARGAFTGAHAARAGMFQLSDGGTIFLDEIGEIPLALQPKLLRVLQNGEVRPVGADQPVAVNTRVIAATNKDLAKEAELGTFREDLFYRLQVIPLHLPPLRSRRSDIPLLVSHFLERTNRKYRTAVRISHEANVYLWEYDWPGNIRELENVVKRLVVLCENNHIGLPDLPSNIGNCASEKKSAAALTQQQRLRFSRRAAQFRRAVDRRSAATGGRQQSDGRAHAET